MTVLENIDERYSEMSSAERKIADYVMRNPAASVECTVAELSERSKVSEATVIRMCKHLGYSGYYQFRICLAIETEAEHSDSQEKGESGGGEENPLEAIFKSYSQEMLYLYENIDKKTVYEVVRLLENAEWVHLLATGNSSSLAQYMGYRLGRRGIKCTFNSSSDYYMNHLNLAGEKDVAFAITRSGSSKVVIDGIKLAKERGLKVITLTEYLKSQSALLSDYVLLSNGNVNKFAYFRSHAQLYEIAVIDAILTIISNDLAKNKEASEYPELIMADTKV